MRRGVLICALLLASCGGGDAESEQTANSAPPAGRQLELAPSPQSQTPAPVKQTAGASSSLPLFVPPTIEALPDPASFPMTPKGLINGAFAPELAHPDLRGGPPFTLSEHVGPTASVGESPKVVIVGMVASWCGPCAASLPYLKKMKDQHGDALEVVLVATDTDAEGRAKEAEKVTAAGLDAPVLEPTQDDLRAWMGGKRNVPHFYILNQVGEVLVQDRGFGNKVRKILPKQIDYAMRHPQYVQRRKPAPAPR